MSFIVILLLPVLCVAFAVRLFFKNQRRGLLAGAVSFSLITIFAIWSIFQSRSSTASLGLIFLPYYASLCGILAWLFIRYKDHSKLPYRILARAMLIANFAMCGTWIVGAAQTNNRNAEVKKIQASRQEQIEENRKYILEKLTETTAHEADWLNAEILTHENDDLFLIPALEKPYVKSETLEKLSHSEFSGVVQMVAGNSLTPAQSLAMIYKNNSPPGYYYQALASNKNTPPDILRKLYENPEPMQRLDQWLAENPATPRDLLVKLAGSKEVWVLLSLMKNSVVDCDIAHLVKETSNHSDLSDTYKSIDNLRNLVKGFESRKCQLQ